MDTEERQLVDAMTCVHGDEAAKVRYERYLEQVRPASVERQLLRLEREIASSCSDQTALVRLLDDYAVFMAKNSSFFWDQRGYLDHLFRSFKVVLNSFAERREHAVRQALRVVCRMGKDVELKRLPIDITSGLSPIDARHVRDKVLDFIRRYKGPSGNEPDVEPPEVQLSIAPSCADLT